MTTTGVTRLLVLPHEQGIRLDLFIANTTDLSRRAARRLIDDGVVLLNQRPTRVQSRTVVAGDAVDVLRPSDDVRPRQPPAVPTPRLLCQDNWLLVADKPAGILSQPARHSAELAFDQIVLLHLSSLHGRRCFLRLVHRLDRLTSGVVLFARNPQALPPLTRAWSSGLVDRRYLVVAEGHPSWDSLEIDRPIARDSSRGWRFSVGTSGQPARTSVRVLDRIRDDLAVLDARPITGRTHQIRVHLAAVGHPVVGDRLYGSRRPGLVSRPLLHAAVLALPHPKDGKPLQVTCSPPEDIASIVPQRCIGHFEQQLDAKSHPTRFE